MNTTRNQKAFAIGAAALALTAAAGVSGGGSAAAPSAARGSAHAGAGWPVSSDQSVRQVMREVREAARDDTGTVIRLTEVTRRFEFIDVGAQGESPGDTLLFESALFTPSGDRVGRDSVRCTFGIRTFVCDATFQITGRGKIVVAGAFFGGEPQLAITGGTREFRDAGGQFLPLDESEDTTRLVFQLTE